ncbi:hypothetical protein AAHE18_03G107800 [Arachis hypogaea]
MTMTPRTATGHSSTNIASSFFLGLPPSTPLSLLRILNIVREGRCDGDGSCDPLEMKTTKTVASLDDSRTRTDGGDGGTATFLHRAALPLAQRLPLPDGDTMAWWQCPLAPSSLFPLSFSCSLIPTFPFLFLFFSLRSSLSLAVCVYFCVVSVYLRTWWCDGWKGLELG